MSTAHTTLEEYVASLPGTEVGTTERAQASAVGHGLAPPPDLVIQQEPSTGHQPPPVQMPSDTGTVSGINGTDREDFWASFFGTEVGTTELAQLSAVGDDRAPSPESATQQGPSTGNPPPPVQMPDNIGAVHGMNGTDPDTGCPTDRPAPTLQLDIGTAPNTGASDWGITHFRLSQLQQVEYREFLNGMEGLYVSPSGMMSLDTASATEIYEVLYFCQYAHDCEVLQALVIGRGETARFSEWNRNRLGGVWGRIRHQFSDDYSPSHNYTVFLPTEDVFAWDMDQRRYIMTLYRTSFPNERDNATGAIQRSAPKPAQMKRLQSSDEVPSLVIHNWEDSEPQGKSIRADPTFMETSIS